jgi:S-layer protein
VTEGLEAFSVKVLDENFAVAQSTDPITIQDAPNSGQAFTLTTSVDEFVGGAGNDTFKAADTTLTALDTLDGGDGVDVMTMNDTAGGTTIPGGVDISNIETFNWRSAGNVGTWAVGVDTTAATADDTLTSSLDLSGISGITTLNVTQAANVAVEASTSTDINISGIDYGIVVDGGQDIDVSDSSAANDITIGATTVNDGTVTVTDTNVGAGAVAVDGGTDVTLNLSETDGSTVTVGQGGGTGDEPTGAVSITSDTDADATDALSSITVTGGSTVTVNQDVTTTDDLTSGIITVTQGAVSVTGTDDTTSVTVNQTEAATGVKAVEAVEGVKETEVVTFVALAAGESVTVEGLTFTAVKALTAEQVAAAFSNLTATDTQDDQGPVSNGIYSGVNAGLFTSGAADGKTVTFTEVTANSGNAVTVSDTASAGNVSVAQGVTGSGATTAIDGVLGVVGGAVTVTDQGGTSATITNIDLDAYGAVSDIVAADALATLSLANSAQGLTVDAAVETLDLTLDNITGGAAIDLDDSGDANNTTLTTLNVTASGAKSAAALTAASATDLTVDAAVGLDLTGSTFGSLETVDINGAGAVDIDDISGEVALNSFDASGNTGGVDAEIETDTDTLTGDITEYVFSAGDDVVTESSTDNTVETKITTGAGDDKVILNGVTALAAEINAGEGTDTLEMDAASAATATASTTFETNVTGFEKLSIGTAAGQETVDLANMDDIDYVVAAGSTGTAQVENVTVTQGTANADDVFTVTINGTAYSYTADGTEVDDQAVATALAAVINADTGLAVTAGAPTAATPSVFTLTADNAGVPFTVAASDANGGANDDQDIAVANATPNAYGLTLDNMTDAGTVELTATGTVLVDMTDATGSADSLNVVADAEDAAEDLGYLEVNDVESISITADDLDADGNADAATSLYLSADSVTSITLDGDADLTLTTDSVVLTDVDASVMTGDLTLSTNGTVAQTITGGSGDDTLTAAGDQDILVGGAGDDTLVAGNLTTLTGGEGADTFDMTALTNNVNSYATITDAEAGDVIETTGTAFDAAGITLGDTAVFQDYANAAINNTDAGDVTWFEFNSNTYVIDNNSGAAAYDATSDTIIKITGSVDLSTASFNATDGTVEFA